MRPPPLLGQTEVDRKHPRLDDGPSSANLEGEADRPDMDPQNFVILY